MFVYGSMVNILNCWFFRDNPFKCCVTMYNQPLSFFPVLLLFILGIFLVAHCHQHLSHPRNISKSFSNFVVFAHLILVVSYFRRSQKVKRSFNFIEFSSKVHHWAAHSFNFQRLSTLISKVLWQTSNVPFGQLFAFFLNSFFILFGFSAVCWSTWFQWFPFVFYVSSLHGRAH